MIHQSLNRIAVCRESLTRQQARELMAAILAGEATDAQIAAVLVALHMKGETVEEIVGFAEAIRLAAVPMRLALESSLDVSGTGREALDGSLPEELLDTCGTGGDASGTFNISTATALVVAGAGVRVAKHGNRGMSSKCGSADVMEALGVKIDLSAPQIAACLRDTGIAFLFAPAVHSAMKFVQPARRELKIRTVFNLLGPLTNPAGASAQVVGVYSASLVEPIAQALRLLGVRRAMVVHGHDGLDEITVSSATAIAELRDGAVQCYEVSPEQFGLPLSPLESLAGGDALENAEIIRAILAGEQSPRRDIVLLNSAAALTVAGKAQSIAEAVPLAREALDSGGGLRALEGLVRFTNSLHELSTVS